MFIQLQVLVFLLYLQYKKPCIKIWEYILKQHLIPALLLSTINMSKRIVKLEKFATFVM